MAHSRHGAVWRSISTRAEWYTPWAKKKSYTRLLWYICSHKSLCFFLYYIFIVIILILIIIIIILPRVRLKITAFILISSINLVFQDRWWHWKTKLIHVDPLWLIIQNICVFFKVSRTDNFKQYCSLGAFFFPLLLMAKFFRTLFRFCKTD